MSDDPAQDPDRVWEVGWDGHEEAQARRLAARPLWVKLEWLEETQVLIERIQAAREQAERKKES